MQNKFFSKIHTYRYKIIFLAFLTVIVNFMAIGAIVYGTVFQQLKESRTNIVLQALQNYSDSLDQFFEEYENGLDQMTRSEALRGVVADPERYQKMVISQLTDFQDSHKSIRLISLGTKGGQYYFDPNRNSVPKGYDPRVRPWYLLAADANDDKVHYTGVYADVNTGIPNITMVKALRNRSGDLIGVLGIILDFNQMIEENKVNLIGSHGYTFVTMGSKYLIYKDGTQIGEEISDETIKNISLSQKSGSYIRKTKGDNELYNYLYYPKVGWTIWSLGYESELMAPIQSIMLKVFQLSAATFILLLVGIVFISKFLVRDMEKLTKAVHRIGRGDYGYRIDIHSKDEIGMLSVDFNHMAEAIERQNQGIMEKTQEIQQQYEEINALYEETQAMNDTLSDLSFQLKESYRMTILSLSNAIEANDHYTRGHCERVTEYALALGRALGLSSDQLVTMEYASLLHDVGKIGVPTEVLNKTGHLSQDEIQYIYKHPELGYSIVVKVPFLKECAEILLQHHERYDGSGYPKGIAGTDIRLEARIISIADAFDAMTSSRPYRKQPLTEQEAMEQLLMNKGTQFDPDMVDCFAHIFVITS
ncbi:MAG: hypothetical protein PWP24_604 [Clostridiales bacterium]|nr:hypothetical protein [Clostridiales bacterium]